MMVISVTTLVMLCVAAIAAVMVIVLVVLYCALLVSSWYSEDEFESVNLSGEDHDGQPDRVGRDDGVRPQPTLH